MEKREYEYLQARFSILIEKAKEHYFSNNKKEAYVNGVLAAKSVLKEVFSNQTETDVAPVRHGRWIDERSKQGYGMTTRCSACGERSGIGGIESNRHKPFCPNCGAKMDEGDPQ